MRRPLRLLALGLLFLAPIPPAGARTAAAQPAAAPHTKTVTALSLLGQPKYPPGFKALDYVNPQAPKGGEIRLYDIGGFDSLNPFLLKGNPAPGLNLVYETLMTSAPDDLNAEYGLLAQSVTVPDDLSWVEYRLRPEARFSDGTPVTADDVVWSFNILKKEGAPLYRFYYANVVKAEKLGPLEVRFDFAGARNRELPQIMGQLPILPEHYWTGKDFARTTLTPWPGSGPYRIAHVDPGRSILYERNPNYWGRDLPVNRGRYNFDRVRYDEYRDPTVAMEGFKAHQYDFRLENIARNWATSYDFPAVKKGFVIRREVPEHRPAGMQAFVFNTRRPIFADRRVREALSDAFDFEWENKTLFYGQYRRTESFFANSDLASSGLPDAAERKLLDPFAKDLPPELFTHPFTLPATDGSGDDRANLLRAAGLLREAGWTIKGGALVGPKGEPLRFQILLDNPAFERVTLPFIANLKRLGVQATIRLVDSAQYQNLLTNFDYDMIVAVWPESDSPGNEQREMWTSAAAKRPGSRNYAGIENPVVDALVGDVIHAGSRADLVTATHALDRVLLWNYYVIPQWYLAVDRIAYWNKFGHPAKPPRYGIDLYSWWVDAKLEAALKAAGEGAGR